MKDIPVNRTKRDYNNNNKHEDRRGIQGRF